MGLGAPQTQGRAPVREARRRVANGGWAAGGSRPLSRTSRSGLPGSGLSQDNRRSGEVTYHGCEGLVKDDDSTGQTSVAKTCLARRLLAGRKVDKDAARRFHRGQRHFNASSTGRIYVSNPVRCQILNKALQNGRRPYTSL